MVSNLRFGKALLVGLLSLVVPTTTAFDNSRFDNLAVYWGQNSYGATHGTDTANFQKRLSFYCADNTIDAIPVAFISTFFGTGGLPVLNLANICNNVDNATFPGSGLANCASLATDVTTCQSRGKIVTLSLGGAGGGVGFQSDTQATQFADQIWNLFLGGSSSTRPFGSAVLDGVDLDVEGGGTTGYTAFVNRLRTHFSGASKKYFITAAPQCVFPDASLGSVLNSAFFDAVYVQFYNNQCGLNNFPIASDWDYGLWDNWARTMSPNKNVKVYIGAPASSTAAGSGFQSVSSLSNIAKQMRNSFPSFGGVMMWDASQAFQNNRYDAAIKQALVAAGGTGFTFPPCSAPAFVSGMNYVGGSQVSFGGYIWQAKFFASSTPTNTPFGEWSAISACSGSGQSAPSSSSVRSSSSTSAPAPTGGTCAGITVWSSSVAYEGGSKVTSGGHLWTAKWWSQGDVPGGAAGDWTDDGPCTTAAVISTKSEAATGKASAATSTAATQVSEAHHDDTSSAVTKSAAHSTLTSTAAHSSTIRADTAAPKSGPSAQKQEPTQTVGARSSRFFRV